MASCPGLPEAESYINTSTFCIGQPFVSLGKTQKNQENYNLDLPEKLRNLCVLPDYGVILMNDAFLLLFVNKVTSHPKITVHFNSHHMQYLYYFFTVTNSLSTGEILNKLLLSC